MSRTTGTKRRRRLAIAVATALAVVTTLTASAAATGPEAAEATPLQGVREGLRHRGVRAGLPVRAQHVRRALHDAVGLGRPLERYREVDSRRQDHGIRQRLRSRRSRDRQSRVRRGRDHGIRQERRLPSSPRTPTGAARSAARSSTTGRSPAARVGTRVRQGRAPRSSSSWHRPRSTASRCRSSTRGTAGSRTPRRSRSNDGRLGQPLRVGLEREQGASALAPKRADQQRLEELQRSRDPERHDSPT